VAEEVGALLWGEAIGEPAFLALAPMRFLHVTGSAQEFSKILWQVRADSRRRFRTSPPTAVGARSRPWLQIAGLARPRRRMERASAAQPSR
jgi:hypothetical protein